MIRTIEGGISPQTPANWLLMYAEGCRNAASACCGSELLARAALADAVATLPSIAGERVTLPQHILATLMVPCIGRQAAILRLEEGMSAAVVTVADLIFDQISQQ